MLNIRVEPMITKRTQAAVSLSAQYRPVGIKAVIAALTCGSRTVRKAA
ncbi:MAG: hypothetical protein KDJ80_14120 [Nitratireductor sp.]|nr:hypothetical protein [Nitratireductor sp.]